MSQPASLKRNIINLLIAQGASFIVPLLQFPYLTRVLGVDEFGLFVFSYSIISFLMIITNFGFELYLPNLLAKPGSNLKTNFIFTHTNIIRIFLFLFGLIGLFLVYFVTDYYKGRVELLALIACAAFFNSFTLLWLYQSKEVIYIYSRITVSIRLLSLLFIFLLVKTDKDIDIALGILAATNGLALLVSYYVARKVFAIRFVKVKLSSTLMLVKNCYEYFISRVGVSLYATLGGFIIGTFSGSLSQVAFYGAAHQLYTAGLQSISAISTPLLPYMSRTKSYNTLFKITMFSFVLTVIGSAFGLIFGEHIISIVYGVDMVGAKDALNVFMITIVVSVIGQHIGYPALLPLDKGRQANLSVMYAGLTQLVLVAALLVFKLPITAVTLAITYFFCDLVMTLYRGTVLMNAYYHQIK